jgi:LysM repeat protein
MRAPYLLVVIIVLHVVVVGSVLFIQGCGTARQDAPQPPPAPVMPPETAPVAPRPVAARPRPLITPPAPERSTPRPPVEIKKYTVQPGDILSRIANKVGVSVREISELNGIDNPNNIRVGQELILPAYAKVDALEKKPSAKPATPAAPARNEKLEPGEVYEVAAGDVLSRIAVRHGTTVKAIMELNNLDSTRILVGQKLRLPAGARQTDQSTARPAPAAERKQEPAAPKQPSLFDTRDLDLDIAEEEIAVPDEPAAPAPDARAAPAPSTKAESTNLFSVSDAYAYTVAEGDTLMQIAKDFVVDPEDLRKMNNLSEDDEVKPGQEILIPPVNL